MNKATFSMKILSMTTFSIARKNVTFSIMTLSITNVASKLIMASAVMQNGIILNVVAPIKTNGTCLNFLAS